MTNLLLAALLWQKAGSDHGKLPLKTTEEDEEEIEEATVSLAAAKQPCVDAAVAELLPEPDGVFTWKQEQRTALKVFSSVEKMFSLYSQLDLTRE